MIFSVQQGHCLSDAAQCVAVSAGDLSVRGHRWYTAGIWDEIITALVLIEAFIPGVIRAKQTTLGSSKTQLGLWGELWAEMQCAASSLSAETNTWWKSLISLPVAATNCLYFVQDYYVFFGEISLDTIFKFCVGFEKKKKACGTSWWTVSHGIITWFLWPFSHRDPAILPQTFHYAGFAFLQNAAGLKAEQQWLSTPTPCRVCTFYTERRGRITLQYSCLEQAVLNRY